MSERDINSASRATLSHSFICKGKAAKNGGGETRGEDMAGKAIARPPIRENLDVSLSGSSVDNGWVGRP